MLKSYAGTEDLEVPVAKRSTTRSVPKIHVCDQSVVMDPGDEDRFVRSGKQVIAACQNEIGLELFLEELKGAVGACLEWCNENSERISSCYFVSCGGKLNFFMVTTSGSFDFDLADALTELSGRIVTGYNLGEAGVEVLQIPLSEWRRFIDPNSSVRVFGDALRESPDQG
ncbi:MAG: hypothetical protein KDA32_02625 [Phycisphaerales bacterium]|nr:hypothetical protein [Phycisphaerales bacterium]